MGGLEHRSSGCKGPGAGPSWLLSQRCPAPPPGSPSGFFLQADRAFLLGLEAFIPLRLPTRLTLTVLSGHARSPSGTSRIPTVGNGAWPAVSPGCGFGAPPLGEKEVPFFVSLLDPSMPGPRKSLLWQALPDCPSNPLRQTSCPTQPSDWACSGQGLDPLPLLPGTLTRSQGVS